MEWNERRKKKRFWSKIEKGERILYDISAELIVRVSRSITILTLNLHAVGVVALGLFS